MITQFFGLTYTLCVVSALMKLIAMHTSSLPESLEYLIMSFHEAKMTDTGDIWTRALKTHESGLIFLKCLCCLRSFHTAVKSRNSSQEFSP